MAHLVKSLQTVGIGVAQWLSCCATVRKVAGSIPDGVIGILHWHNPCVGTAVAQWLRCCAANRKVAGSIPDGVIGIFH